MDNILAPLLSRRAPRYTSYPTAVQFTPKVGETEARRWLASLPEDAPLSLYLHVPFCAQVCWYCACNIKLARREAPVRDYAAALVDEIALVAGVLGGRRPATRIHMGRRHADIHAGRRDGRRHGRTARALRRGP